MTIHHPAQIVLIEDNPADAFMLRRALDASGFDYRMDVLRDGEQALHFVRDYYGPACGPTPCVLVLDLHLPKYDGAEVLQAIREEPALAHLKVVALTGMTSREEETKIRSLGVRLYLNKPNDLQGYAALAEDIVAICNEHVLKVAV